MENKSKLNFKRKIMVIVSAILFILALAASIICCSLDIISDCFGYVLSIIVIVFLGVFLSFSIASFINRQRKLSHLRDENNYYFDLSALPEAFDLTKCSEVLMKMPVEFGEYGGSDNESYNACEEIISKEVDRGVRAAFEEMLQRELSNL